MFIHQTQRRPSGLSATIQALCHLKGRGASSPLLGSSYQHTHLQRPATRRSTQAALQQERVWLDTKKNFLPRRDIQLREREHLKVLCSPERIPGSAAPAPFLHLILGVRLHNSQAPLEQFEQCYNSETHGAGGPGSIPATPSTGWGHGQGYFAALDLVSPCFIKGQL